MKELDIWHEVGSRLAGVTYAAAALAPGAGVEVARKIEYVRGVWHASYLALSTVLGVPAPEAEAAVAGGLDAEARAVAHALRTTDRRARALAIARPLAAIARAVDAARLA